MHMVHSENRKPHEMGVSIASRWPIQRVEELVADSDRHTILLGDLDAEPDSASVRFLRGLQSLEEMSVCYRDAWERAASWRTRPYLHVEERLAGSRAHDWPFSQIDHILVRCGARSQPTLDLAACELAFDEPVDGTWASDHIGVLADLVVPGT
jgi:endonuclease/exonuclease/phosphatase family metal-dependent hydrolase